MVSHICLLVELSPICNCMAASLCLKSCEDHSLLKSYNGGLWKKHLQVWALKKKIRLVLLDTLAAMHGTCNFLCIILVSMSPVMISALKSPPFQNKNH